MITRDQQAQLDEVSRFNAIRDARTCAACEAPKAKGYPLCLGCMRALPENIRRNLYQPGRAGFDAAYQAATHYIEEHGNGRSKPTDP